MTTLHPIFCHQPRTHLGGLPPLFLASLLLLLGCKGTEVADSWEPLISTTKTDQHTQDSVLNARVKEALVRSPVTHAVDIGVDSHQGVVLLSGMVADQTQLDLALFITQNVEGVSQVDSFMFSTGVALTLPTPSSYTPAPGLLSRQRAVRRAPSPQTDALQSPQTAASPLLATENTSPPPKSSVAMRRLMKVTYGILGISNVYDELLIGQ